MFNALAYLILFIWCASSSTGWAFESSIKSLAMVQRGQKAYGLTVIQDQTIERFELELIGVADNALGPHQPLIVAKLTDPKFALAGVVAGMSGSPIYIGDTLIGALGYALGSFMKEGICGITPIESMRLLQHMHRQFPLAYNDKNLSDKSFTPLALPVYINGLEPNVANHFAPQLEAFGMHVHGIQASTDNTHHLQKSAPLFSGFNPGDAIALTLVKGDISVSASGTVTEVNAGQVLAFGHPFMGLGAISIPMMRARVLTIIPSYMRSFKMTENLNEVGAVLEDRQSAILGALGVHADTLAVDVEISNNPETSQVYQFHYDIAKDLKLTPELVHMVIANSIAKRANSGTYGTIEIEAHITLNDNRLLKVGSTLAIERDQSLPIFAALVVAKPFMALWNNPFEKNQIKNIVVKINLLHEVNRLKIDAIRLRSNQVAPGQSIEVGIGLSHEKKPMQWHYVNIPVATYSELSNYEIWAMNGFDATKLEDNIYGPQKPQNFNDVVEVIKKQHRDDVLYLMLIRKTPTLKIGEQVLGRYPLTFAHQLLSSNNTDTRVTHTEQKIAYKVAVPLPSYFLLGQAHTNVKIKPMY